MVDQTCIRESGKMTTWRWSLLMTSAACSSLTRHVTGTLIAGGVHTGHKAEFYLPGLHCELPDLPAGHYKARHVQVDNVLCGGYERSDNNYLGNGCLREYF